MTKGEREALSYWMTEAARLKGELLRMRAAHEIWRNRDWFPIAATGLPGVDSATEPGVRHLFTCDHQGTHPVVTLGPKDVLVVARYTGEDEREEAVTALAGLFDPAGNGAVR